MITIGEQIREARKQKGLTQEQLAEKVDRNLRTIQRIENSENTSRNDTLDLICEVLEINLDEKPEKQPNEIGKKIVSFIPRLIFLVPLNFLFMIMFGYLTIDSNTSLNTSVGAIGGGVFMAYFIVSLTPKISNIERLIKYGTGSFIYIFMIAKSFGFSYCFERLMIPAILLFLFVLFYGNQILRLVCKITK